MTAKSSLLFALRLIFPKGERTSARKSLSGALLCIGISLVPLVVVLTVANGMIFGMTERLIGLSSSHLEAVVRGNSSAAADAESLVAFANKLGETDGVKSAFPELDFAALAAGSSFRTGVQVRAVLPEIFTANDSFRSLFKIIEGSYDDFANGATKANNATQANSAIRAIVGQNTAERLNLHAGDAFRLISASQSATGMIVPRVANLQVAAIISSGYQELDAAWLFVPLGDGFRIIGQNAARRSVLIETDDAFSPELVRVQRACAEAAGADATVYRWDELNQAQYENFSSTRVMLVFIMLLIVLVASVNISSALVMLVMEKRREIAILKSVGATQGGIAFSFLLCGTAAGIGGVLAGLPLGLLCAVNVNQIVRFLEEIVNAGARFLYILSGGGASDFSRILLMDPAYYLSEIPVLIPFRDLALIVVATILLSLAASLIPAYRAGREKPLETLRKV